ncbi:MAG: endonuclease/exonuclease/phosphatase family protein [Puniceicoccaceae bacterium]
MTIIALPFGLLGVVFWLAFGISPLGNPQEREPAEISIMSWNVYNYLEMDRMTEDGFRPAYPKPEAEKAALRAVIQEIDPDLLLLQEIGGASYLKELQRDLAREGLEYAHGFIAEGADPVRKLGILSKIEPIEVVEINDLNFHYRGDRELVRRGLQGALFEHGGGELWVYNLHLKSRFTNFSDDPQSEERRKREAGAIRDFLITKHGETGGSYLVMGDFNDHPASGAVARFLSIGGRELGRLIDAADSRGNRWTHRYAKHDSYTRVDLAVASVRFLDLFQAKGSVVDTSEVLEASDHRPLLLTVSAMAFRNP